MQFTKKELHTGLCLEAFEIFKKSFRNLTRSLFSVTLQSLDCKTATWLKKEKSRNFLKGKFSEHSNVRDRVFDRVECRNPSCSF